MTTDINKNDAFQMKAPYETSNFSEKTLRPAENSENFFIFRVSHSDVPTFVG